MLESFFVDNYKLFQELEIPTLKRVNLIVGKNNVGKTALLEALNIYTTPKGFGIAMSNNLINRHEQNEIHTLTYTEALPLFKRGFNTWKNPIKLYGDKKIQVVFRENDKGLLDLALDEIQPDDFINSLIETNAVKNIEQDLFPLNDIENYFNKRSENISENNSEMVYAIAHPNTFDYLEDNWKKILFTTKEDYVLKALRLLSHDIQGLAFIEQKKRQVAIVKIKGGEQPVLLTSLGGGVLQMLRIILEMVSLQDGVLFIDELETGLHWSIQKDVWKLIFTMSQELNVQVLATTHSRDAIEAMQKAAAELGMEEDGNIIKLRRMGNDGPVRAVCMRMDELKEMIAQDLEIR